MRKLIFLTLFTGFLSGHAQQQRIDSLKNTITIAANDTLRMVLLNILADNFAELNPDSSLHYAEKAIELSVKLKFRLEEVQALGTKGYAQTNMGNYPRSLQTLLSAIAIASDPDSEKNTLPDKYPDDDEYVNRRMPAHIQRICRLGRAYQHIGVLYTNAKNYEKEISYYVKALQFVNPTNNKRLQSILNGALGRAYLAMHKLDTALIKEQLAYDQALEAGYKRYLGSILFNLAKAHSAKGNKGLAIVNYKKSIVASKNANYLRGIVASDLELANLYLQMGKRDSSIHYANDGLKIARYANTPVLVLRSYTSLAAFYRSINRNDSAVKYQALIIKMNDSLFNSRKLQQFQNIDFDEQQRVQQIELAKSAYKSTLFNYALIAGIGISLLIATMLFRNNIQKQKAKQKIENAYEQLKATQSQLIQSEKMASLGELTAGIAHEIQNPLNFVNNFSEVNKELLIEMKDEIEKGNLTSAKETASNVIDNEEKIIHHGKRADGIVKSMLQHSRSNSGQKELTDINELCDEYLRLSFHGLRAKDKSFNAKFEMDFDPSVGKVNVVAQEIGRVILNLINNAFYAVSEKKRTITENYEPAVTVITKRIAEKVLIRVKDNGTGIPQRALDKIFQPFFTTKPTGLGTGLGLSLSYDIITKGHGGELKVETKEGEGTTFIIILPSLKLAL